MVTKKIIEFIKKNYELLSILFLFIVLPILAFWKNFDFTGLNLTFFNADFIGFYYPDYSLGVSLFGHFREILWDPYNLLGLPHLAGVDRVGLFYPLKFLFYFIGIFVNPAHRIFLISYFSVFHVTIACTTFFIFSKKILRLTSFPAFFASLVFGFNGAFVRLIAFPNHMLSVAYLPLTLYFLHRSIAEKRIRFSVFAGLSMAPVLLSGYTPVFIYNALFIVLYLVLTFFRQKESSLIRSVISISTAFAFAFLVSAPALIPNLENAAQSERQKYNIVGSSNIQLLPVSVIHYIFPVFFEPQEGLAGIVYGYVGIITLILAFVALTQYKNTQVRDFVILLLIFLFLAFGRATFLHSFAYLTLPKYSFFRFPAMLNYLVGFCFACLAGIGLSTLANANKISNYLKVVIFSGGLLLSALLLLAYLLKATFMANNKLDTAIASMLFTTLFYFVSVFALFLYTSNPKAVLVKIFIVVILTLDIFTLISKSAMSNGDVDPRAFTGSNDLITWLKNNTTDRSRVDLQDLSVRYNSAENKIFQTGGYYGLYPQTYTIFFKDYVDSDTGSYKADSKAMDIAGVKYITSSKEFDLSKYSDVTKVHTFKVEAKHANQFMTAGGTMLPAGTTISVYENKGYFPKLKLFTDIEVAYNDLEAAEKLKTIDANKTVIVTSLNTNYAQRNSGKNSIGKVTLDKYENYEIISSVDLPSRSLLMLNDSYYPRWRVTVDNKPAELVKADVTFRGVLVPEGKHVIRFYYDASDIVLGFVISILTLSFIWYFLFYRKSKLYDPNQ